MGIADLNELAVTSRIESDELAGSTGAVDAFNWLYRYMTITVRYTDPKEYTTREGTDVPNLIGIIRGLPKFFEHRFFPVFVFDGAPVALKQKELSERRKRRRHAATEAAAARRRGEPRKAAQYRAQAQRMTKPIRRTTEELFELLDLPYFEAPSEAEAQAAHMARTGAVDYAVTDDYDALVYGAPLTIREFTSEGPPECMDLEATLDKHAITWEQLVDIAILCGTDYNEGIRGIGPNGALAEVKQHGDLETVLAQLDETIENADRIRDLFLHPRVTNEYEFEPTCSPDLSAARTFLVDQWEIPESTIARAFERLEESRTAWA